jgi:hypothetical protein
MLDLIEKIAAAVAVKGSQWPIYGGGELDRTEFLTSSENTRCLRELKFNKLTPPEIAHWGFFERGHSVEAWVVGKLVEVLGDNDLFAYHGDRQRSFLDRSNGLSGTPDGLWSVKKGRKWQHTLLEFKSIDPRTNLERITEPKTQHWAQVQQNMYLLQHNGFDVTKAVVLYIDASDFQRHKQFEVIYDPAAVVQFTERAARLFAAETPADLPAEGLTNSGCDYCAFTEQCSAIQMATKAARPNELPTPAKMPTFTPRGVTETIREYAEIKTDMKDMEVRASALADTIKAYAQDTGVDLISTSKYVAKVESIAGRKTLDLPSYEAATGIPAEGYYKVGKPSLRLEVKPVVEE